MAIEARDLIIALDIYYNHNWNNVYEVVQKKNTSMFNDTAKLDLLLELKLYALFKEGYKTLVIIDEDYPKWILHNVIRPPFVIYYKGNVDTVEQRFRDIIYNPACGCFIE